MQLVLLDRDGVINYDSTEFIKSADEWKAIPGSIEAIAKLFHAGIKIAVVSNQSGIGRGLFTLDALHIMETKLQYLLKKHSAKVDAFYYCPHLPDEGCECRKPKPGLILEACRQFGYSKEETIFICDSFRDIQAANNAGIGTILVKTGNGEKTLAENPAIMNDIAVYSNLLTAVESLLKT